MMLHHAMTSSLPRPTTNNVKQQTQEQEKRDEKIKNGVREQQSGIYRIHVYYFLIYIQSK